jgi:hypothetical protein
MRDTRGAQGCALMMLSAVIVMLFVAMVIWTLMKRVWGL